MMNDRRIEIGRISGVFGVKGWVKVYSETRPRENILRYKHWQLAAERGDNWNMYKVAEGQPHGKTVIARLTGIADRDAAASLVGSRIAIMRSELPPPGAGEYYWVDVEGLNVINLDGIELGTVDHIMETGANDVLVVTGERERLIPFVEPDYVKQVNFDSGKVVVDWDPEF